VRIAYTFSATEHFLSARVGLDAQHARDDDLVHALGITVDDDEWRTAAAQLVRDNAADAAVPAQDEMVVEMVDHSTDATLLESEVQPAFDDDCGEQRERIERRADAADEQNDRERLTGPRQRVHLTVPHGRNGDDGHVEGVPCGPALDHHVSRRPAGNHEGEQADREPGPGKPPPRRPWRWQDASAGGTLRH
jgi:hypothetical protein